MPPIPQVEIDDADLVSAEHEEHTLDPLHWESFRIQAHRMLDDILDYTQNIRQRPVWQPIPDEVRRRFRAALPIAPSPLDQIHEEFKNLILPFAVGNAHPGFMGWVHGGGTPVGMLAEMLAAGLNANLGGRDQIPIEVERQITRWMQEIFGFPETASGLFVTGTSMANFIAVVVARDAELGSEVRRQGVAAKSKRLVAYGSKAIHGCVAKAMDLAGIGGDALRLIPTDKLGRMDLPALEMAIQNDLKAGHKPFLVVGTAGTVDTGAIDNLASLADLARREKLWFHVDGACGALAMLAPDLAPKLAGIERADSLAFDFHKWGQVPYDAGFILVRDGALQRKAFEASSAYLRRETRGLAAGTPWPCDYGPDLSRGFRALKTWFTLKVYGSKAIGDAISRTCALARYLEHRIVTAPELELLAPVELNIVCFRYCAADSDRVNASIVVALQESGRVAPSTTTIGGRLAIRAAIVNHRTGRGEIDALLDMTLALGRAAKKSEAQAGAAVAAPAPAHPPLAKHEAKLLAVKSRLSSNPGSVELLLERAILLSGLGRYRDAVADYIKVLECDPNNLAALNNVACVLIGMGNRTAARTVYGEIVLRHPGHLTSRVNLGNLILEECNRLIAYQQPEQARQLLLEAREHFQQVLRINADFEKAHEGLSYVMRALGNAPKAELHRRKAFGKRYIIPSPYRGNRRPISLLHLTSTTGGNVRLQGFLDDHIFQKIVVLPEFYKTETPCHPTNWSLMPSATPSCPPRRLRPRSPCSA